MNAWKRLVTPGKNNTTKLLFVGVSAFISLILALKGKKSRNLMISPEKTRVSVFQVLVFLVLVFWVLGLRS